MPVVPYAERINHAERPAGVGAPKHQRVLVAGADSDRLDDLQDRYDVAVAASAERTFAMLADGGYDAVVLLGELPDLTARETERLLRSDPATATLTVVTADVGASSAALHRAVERALDGALDQPAVAD